MTSPAYPEFFRHRAIGRAPSPPTWACYEQIPYDDDYSDSGSEDNSCSEDEEDYARAMRRDVGTKNESEAGLEFDETSCTFIACMYIFGGAELYL